MESLGEIVTERLRLVPFVDRHLTRRYVEWLNDPEVVRYSEQRHRKHDLASCQAYLETMRLSGAYFYAIEDVCGGRGHVGNVSVAVDRMNGLADISIMIGERATWGEGFGLEAWRAVMRALLENGRFRKVSGGAIAANRAMVAIMKKTGMKPDGRRRAQYLIEGVPVDVVYYAAFSESWGANCDS